MTNKRIQLPKEGLVDPRQRTPGEQFIDVSDDVQGHGFPLPAPPADFLRRGSGHGGEALPTNDEDDSTSR
jgi:hypothetical protein